MHNLSKEAAVIMMELGSKLSHISFPNGEWVVLEGFTIVDETGDKVCQAEAMAHWAQSRFDTGWYVVDHIIQDAREFNGKTVCRSPRIAEYEAEEYCANGNKDYQYGWFWSAGQIFINRRKVK